MTPHGFIMDVDKDLKAYKAANQSNWKEYLEEETSI